MKSKILSGSQRYSINIYQEQSDSPWYWEIWENHENDEDDVVIDSGIAESKKQANYFAHMVKLKLVAKIE